MRLPTRTSNPRHLAGAVHQVERPVRDHLEPPGGPLLGIDIDIDAPIAWDEADAQPRARVARTRIAFAVSITLAALPVIVLDNFPATADEGTKEPASATEDIVDIEDADDGPLSVEVDLTEPLHGTIDLEAPTTLVTVAPPTVYVATPVTTIVVAPTTPTTAAPKVQAPTTTKAPVTTTTAAPPTTVARKVISPDPTAADTWEQLARCESNGDWAANTGNGYYGGLQFSLATWQGMGGTGYPHENPKATQIELGKRLQARSGWAAWPGCARKLGWS